MKTPFLTKKDFSDLSVRNQKKYPLLKGEIFSHFYLKFKRKGRQKLFEPTLVKRTLNKIRALSWGYDLLAKSYLWFVVEILKKYP